MVGQWSCPEKTDRCLCCFVVSDRWFDRNIFRSHFCDLRRCLGLRGVDLSHSFSTRQVCAQEGSLFKGCPTWRYRVLKTALGLRPRIALSSASGQSIHSKLEFSSCIVGSRQIVFGFCQRGRVALRTPLGIGSSRNCEAAGGYRMSRRNRRWPA